MQVTSPGCQRGDLVEALLTAARKSPHPCDFAPVAMLGLLGLRIFEATSADITDLARLPQPGTAAGEAPPCR